MAADRPNLDDLLACSRIHDWIADQYNFALSESDDSDVYAHPPPSLRDSCLLPDFDLFVTPSTPHVHDVEHDRDGDAREYLVKEMNSWRLSIHRDKPLPNAPRAPVLDWSAALPGPLLPASSSSLPPSPARIRPSLPFPSSSRHSPAEEPETDPERVSLASSASFSSTRARTRTLRLRLKSTASQKRAQRYNSAATALPSPLLQPLSVSTTASSPSSYSPSTPPSSTPALTHASSSFSTTASQIHLPSLLTGSPVASLSSKPSRVSLSRRRSRTDFDSKDDLHQAVPPLPRADVASEANVDKTFLWPSQPLAERSRWSIASSTHVGVQPTVPVIGKKQATFRSRLKSTIGRLTKKPSTTLTQSTVHKSPSAPTAPTHQRQLSSVSELGYMSDSHDVEDPFARPPPADGDYAEFLARAEARPSEDEIGSRRDGASYITDSYISGSVSYLPPSPLCNIVAKAHGVSELGEGRDHEGDSTVRASPAPSTTATELKEKKKNRISWASSKSAVRTRLPRKQLIISGLAPNPNVPSGEVRLESMTSQERAMRSWCLTFGEVRKMSRAVDGALIVDWKSSAVADRVCRLRAQVQIKGVGSVQLSWTESRRKQS